MYFSNFVLYMNYLDSIYYFGVEIGKYKEVEYFFYFFDIGFWRFVGLYII